MRRHTGRPPGLEIRLRSGYAEGAVHWQRNVGFSTPAVGRRAAVMSSEADCPPSCPVPRPSEASILTCSLPRPGLSLLVCLLLAVASCAGRPLGTMVPIAGTVAGASTVDMLVATTRAPSPVAGVVYTGNRGNTLSVDNIVVSVPPPANRDAGELTYPTANAANPQTEFAVLKLAPMDDAAAQRWFDRVAGTKQGDVLIFVHGFNTTYEESVFRFAQIAHDTAATAAPILFSWPSHGSVFDYLYDRESANFSRNALEEIIEKAADDPRVRNVTVMAHSMGSWLTMEALRQLSIRRGKLPAKVRNVILASPDLDVDVFSHQLDEIDTQRTQLTIFASTDDRALQVSRRLAGGVQRLGAIDVSQEPYRSGIEAKGVDVIDLSALQSGSALNHSKFAESPQIVRLIGQRLIAGQAIGEEGISLGETLGAAALGTAQTVGSAAGAVVTAPGALISQRGREEFGRQVGNMGRNLGGTLQTATGQ